MNSRSTTIVIAFVTIILLVAVGALYVINFLPKKNTDFDRNSKTNGLPTPKTTGFPSSVSNSNETLGTPETSLAHAFTSGTDIATSTWNSDDFYIVYPANGSASSTPEYEIDYFPSERSFVIGIFQEPIGEIRRKATADLADRMGVSGKEVCGLSVRVIVPEWVNEYYAYKNQGLPGCPGATKFNGDPTF